MAARSFGKRVVIQIGTVQSKDPNPLMRGGVAHRHYWSTTYDKNVEEHVRSAVVPDHAVDSGPTKNNYWSPHPRTGVFGPADAQAGSALAREPAGQDGVESVLDQTAWFRPLEGVDKPPLP